MNDITIKEYLQEIRQNFTDSLCEIREEIREIKKRLDTITAEVLIFKERQKQRKQLVIWLVTFLSAISGFIGGIISGIK